MKCAFMKTESVVPSAVGRRNGVQRGDSVANSARAAAAGSVMAVVGSERIAHDEDRKSWERLACPNDVRMRWRSAAGP